jgi:hypothetical protein
VVVPIEDNMVQDLIILGFGILTATLAIVSAFGLRKLKFTEGALIASLFVGALLGPTVLGRIAPETFDSLWIGRSSEISALTQEASEARAKALVESSRMVEPSADTTAQPATEPTSDLTQKLTALRDHNQKTVSWLVVTLAIIVVGCTNIRATKGAPGSLLLAAWMVVICGGSGVLISSLLGIQPISGLWIGAACGVATYGRSRTHRTARNTLSAPTQFATIMTLAGLVVFAPAPESSEVSGFSAGALLLVAFLARFLIIDQQEARNRLRGLSKFVITPALLAITMLRIDLLEWGTSLWVAVILWLVMSDLKWLVATIHLRKQKGGLDQAAVSTLGLLGNGTLPAVIAVFAFWTGQIDETVTIWILIAASLAELEAVGRGWCAVGIASLKRFGRTPQNW